VVWQTILVVISLLCSAGLSYGLRGRVHNRMLRSVVVATPVVVVLIILAISDARILLLGGRPEDRTSPEAEQLANLHRQVEEASRAVQELQRAVEEMGIPAIESPPGRIEVEDAPLVNGKKEGVFRMFFTAGSKRIPYAEVPFVAGLKHGTAKYYSWRTGKVTTEEPYAYGLMHGELRGYYPDTGNLRWIVPFEHGKRQGTAKVYSQSGRVLSETPCSQGREHGLSTWWDEKGDIVAQGTYEQGEMWTGTFVEWIGPGLERDGDQGSVIWAYRDGVLHGRTVWRDAQGAVIADGEYRQGKPWNGSFIDADPLRKAVGPGKRGWSIRSYRNGSEVAKKE